MPALTEKVKALETARALVARLENELAEDLGLTRPLQIPAGSELRDGGSRLLVITKQKRKYTRNAAPATDAKAVAMPGKKRRKRAVITDDMRARVLELRKAGKMTSAAIAREVRISEASVNNIVFKAKKAKA